MNKDNDYIILKKIGQGSFGNAFLVKKNNDIDNIKYVMKRINLKKIDFKVFDFEKQALEKISKLNKCNNNNNNNISSLCLIDSFITDKDYVIITNYLEQGIPLTELLYPETISFEDILYIMQRLLSQLFLLHENDVIHGDIKPDNIIIQLKNPKNLYLANNIKNVIFIDFGLSCMFKNCYVGGTLKYAAPEVIRVIGNKDLIFTIEQSKKTDIWSLGVVFFQMMNKELPYPNTEDYSNQLKLARGNIIYEDKDVIKKSLIPNDLIKLNDQVITTLINFQEYYEKNPIIYNYYFDHKNEVASNKLSDLVESMLTINPDKRPSIKEISTSLQAIMIITSDNKTTRNALSTRIKNNSPDTLNSKSELDLRADSDYDSDSDSDYDSDLE